jgi:hypothetical protein
MSAIIYQFPLKGRRVAGVHHEAYEPEANVIPPSGAKILSGSNWYHDDAIQEAERLRKK